MPDATETDWQTRAAELHEKMGVPPVRARVVALREAGFSHAEVSDELGMSGPSQSAHHCRLYREQRASSRRLLADGPEI